MRERDVFITGVGSFSPGEPVPFDQIENVLGELSEAPPKIRRWITRMQPIMKGLLDLEHVHYVLDPETRTPTENNITMSVKSAERALQMAGIDASEIDLLIYGGAIMERFFCPPTSVLIQDALNIEYCAEMSIHSNCTSICKALQVAADSIANGRYSTALVLTSQISSACLRAEFFNQQVLTKQQVILRWFLSDGAGALVVTSKNPSKPCFKILGTYLESVGANFEPSMSSLLGGNLLNLPEVYESGWHHVTQDFRKVSKLSPSLFEQGLKNMIAKTGLGISEEERQHVKWFLATIPMKHLLDVVVKMAREEWDMPQLQFYSNLRTRGYTGPPSTVIGLDGFMQEVPLSQGDIIVGFVEESSKWMQAGFILEYCE